MSVASLLARRRDKQRELETYRKRKSQTEKINSKLNSDFDDNISDARNNNEQSANEFMSAIQGAIPNISNVASNIETLKEKYIWNDVNLSDVSSNLNSEISRCQAEIARLEAEIRSLDRQIEAERAAEAAAAEG